VRKIRSARETRPGSPAGPIRGAAARPVGTVGKGRGLGVPALPCPGLGEVHRKAKAPTGVAGVITPSPLLI